MTLEEWWNSLEPEIREWLAENPGCVVLPRTVVNAINASTGGALPGGPHGESGLSPGDQEFLRRQAAHVHHPPGRAGVTAEALAQTAAELERAAGADGRTETCRAVLEHLLAVQRSLEATLRNLAAELHSYPARDLTEGEQAAAELEAAAMTADLLVEELARAANALR